MTKLRPNSIVVFACTLLTVAGLCAFSIASDKNLSDPDTGFKFIRSISNPSGIAHREDSAISGDLKSPVGYVSNGILTLYQTVISSQDNSSCNFTPSCSHFARDAISNFGFVKGCLLGADRLTRCHPMTILGKYRMDIKTGKAIDPIDHYLPRP